MTKFLTMHQSVEGLDNEVQEASSPSALESEGDLPPSNCTMARFLSSSLRISKYFSPVQFFVFYL